MALNHLVSLPAPTFTKLPPRCRISTGSSVDTSLVSHRVRIQCLAITENSSQANVRRSANYQPSIWDDDYVQSLMSKYVGKSSAERVQKLGEVVKLMLDNVVDPLRQMELVDVLQRLGLSHHFENEIEGILRRIYNKNFSKYKHHQGSLYAVALEFRLLRQHGYDIPTEIFNNFRDDKRNFLSLLHDDCKGILSLYEAAFLFKEGEESIFHEARNFTTTYLKEYIKHNNEDQYLSTLVKHALEIPLHWRIPRAEARWFIDVYGRKHDSNHILLELAKLDFNIVQATHQEDLKYASSWWKNLDLVSGLNFARDRLVEIFLCTVAISHEPQFGYDRRMGTKINMLVAVVDDVYDIYGTLDELELFTDAVDRWDLSAIEQLPQYMKICFLALYNSTNEIGYEALKKHGVDIIPYLSKVWADLCKAYLLEAKWYYNKYNPTFQEYIDNGWVSISTSVVLQHAYFANGNPITKEALECLQDHNGIMRWTGVIFRIADDLGTSSEELQRGDISKSIQCYMHETEASEEEAREHVRELITLTWMKLNNYLLGNQQLSSNFIRGAMNLARAAQYIYQHGDGVGIPDSVTKDRILSLLVNPIP